MSETFTYLETQEYLDDTPLTLQPADIQEIHETIIHDGRAQEFKELFDAIYDQHAGPTSGRTYQQIHHSATQHGLQLLHELDLGDTPAGDIQKLCDLYVSFAIARPEAYAILSGHFALVMRAIKQMGNATPVMQEYLDRLANKQHLGVFLLTESAVGSNAKNIQTTATINAAQGTITLNTPTPHNLPAGAIRPADKFMPNVADRDIPTVSIVAAQVIADGSEQGVGLFVVPMNTPDEPTGIEVRRMGEKAQAPMAHAEITYRNVQIPLDNWLPGKTAGITSEGHYYNSEPHMSARYLAAIENLDWGRAGLSAGSVAAVWVALQLISEYGQQREAGGGKKLFEQKDVQADLARHTVNAFAITSLSNAVRRNPDKLLTSIEKPYITSLANTIATYCRDRSGARGHFKTNLYPLLIGNIEGAHTAEGEARTLEVAVGRGLSQAAQHGIHANLLPPSNELSEWGSLVEERAKKLPQLADATIGGNDTHKEYTKTTGDYLALGALAQAASQKTGAVGAALSIMADIFAMEKVNEHAAWYVEHGYLDAEKAARLRAGRVEKINKLIPILPQLIETFGIPKQLLNAPITSPNYALRHQD